ncbi:spermidine synthase [Legionella beliardensis]|uniref:Spermidine synthase n=1 Tax=Legionella beliardensis TaxID=91822 RepID=A0A378I2P2_9GAMM|nr:hypothetical protein [Legionella beliardensis]STX29263.1 spermidine synthase [Legionella beliardensis]
MLWKSLAGRCIYRSDNMRVFDNYFFRWLKFNSNAFQSLLNKHAPHRPALNYVKALTFAARQLPGDTCMLGLGGASVAHTLAPRLHSGTLTAVEMNAEVIDVATHYFMVDKLKNLVIVHDEAHHFIKHCQQNFKHLLIDISDANSFPSSCNNKEFFIHCARLISNQGILAINIANAYEHQAIFSMLQQQFGNNIITIPVKRCVNIIFIATFKDNFNHLIHYFKNTKEVKQLIWDKKWGCMANLRYGTFF